MTLLARSRQAATAARQAFSRLISPHRRLEEAHEAASTEKGADAKASAAPATPLTSVYVNALKQWSTAVNWLIGALGAVAAAMIAGSQLSSLGQLSGETEYGRLRLAMGTIVAAVGLVLAAIAWLFWAQSPSNTDFSRLNELAVGTRTFGLAAKVRKQVSEDSSLNRGKENLGGLLKALSETRQEYYKLRNNYYARKRELAREPHAAKRETLDAECTRLAAELDVVDTELTEYRVGLLRVAQLDAFLRTRRRYRVSSSAVLVLSVLATFAFVTFAWAANPPHSPDDAVPQRPVAATLTLSSTGQKALQRVLGTPCTSVAATAGIPVIALRSASDGVEVVTIPSAKCAHPQNVTVTIDEGNVTANGSVSAGS